MYRILLVEDDKRIAEAINDYFVNQPEQQMEIIRVSNGDDALEKLYENTYDLVLLDIMLPGVDGFFICREIRHTSDTPIIFLTAKAQEEDVLHGYDLGCDDYIIKPFPIATLYAKVNALLNRSKGTVLGREMTAGGISLNERRMLLQVNGQTVELAPIEYQILKILLEQKNAVVSRDTFIVRIWGYDFDGDERILDNHMKKLRKALGAEGKRIKTVVGKGYKLTE